MTAQHTPGQWRHTAEAKPQAGRHWHCIKAEVDLGDGTMSWETIGEFYEPTETREDTPDAEIAANARLAAAAPEMLTALRKSADALEMLIREYGGIQSVRDALAAARAAIARATGEAP